MPVVLINMESSLMGEAVAAAMHESGDFRILREADPQRIGGNAFLSVTSVLLLEVTDHKPFLLEDRLGVCREVRRVNPGCKLALLVNETLDSAAAGRVKQAKMDGLIDEFIYDSTGVKYMTALLETLGAPGRDRGA